MLSRQIEDALNVVVRAKTPDPVLFISNHMKKSPPPPPSSPTYKAIELRDVDEGTYLGNGVSRVVTNINEKIYEALVGMDPTLQVQIDQAMIDLDKTEKNVVPLYKHIAGKTNYHLPVPAITLITGGKHAGNNLAIQVLNFGGSKCFMDRSIATINSRVSAKGTMQTLDARNIELFLNEGYINGMLKAWL
ncbi:hypothetical protein ACS0TY_014531 [Phlomoides rotata]